MILFFQSIQMRLKEIGRELNVDEGPNNFYFATYGEAVTLSKVAVHKVPFAWLHTARPI